MTQWHSTTLFNVNIRSDGSVQGEAPYAPNYNYYSNSRVDTVFDCTVPVLFSQNITQPFNWISPTIT